MKLETPPGSDFESGVRSNVSFKLDNNEVSNDGMERASTLFVADSGTTRHAVNFKYSMTNYPVLPDHNLSTGSGEDLETEGYLVLGTLSSDFDATLTKTHIHV